MRKAWVCFNLGCLAVQGILSWADGSFFPSDHVLSFLSSPYVWGDVVLLSPVFGIIGKYAEQWQVKQRAWWSALGCALSVALHCYYVAGGVTNPTWVTHDGQLPWAGNAHLYYQAMALSVGFMFFFASYEVTKKDAALVATLLGLHMVPGVIIPVIMARQSLLQWQTLTTLTVGWSILALGYFRLTRKR